MPPTLMCPIVFDFELRNETKMKRQIVLHIINTDEKSRLYIKKGNTIMFSGSVFYYEIRTILRLCG